MIGEKTEKQKDAVKREMERKEHIWQQRGVSGPLMDLTEHKNAWNTCSNRKKYQHKDEMSTLLYSSFFHLQFFCPVNIQNCVASYFGALKTEI